MRVRVIVKTDAKKEEVKRKGESLVISVREEAKRNEANARVKILVARAFSVSTSQVRFLSGSHSPHKQFEITH